MWQLQVGRCGMHRPGESQAEVSHVAHTYTHTQTQPSSWPEVKVRETESSNWRASELASISCEDGNGACPVCAAALSASHHPDCVIFRCKKRRCLLRRLLLVPLEHNKWLTFWHPCRLRFQKEPPLQLRASISGGAGWNCRGTAHKEHRRRSPNHHGQSVEASIWPEWNLLPPPERG